MADIPQAAERPHGDLQPHFDRGQVSTRAYTAGEEDWRYRLSEAIVAKVIPSLYAAHGEAGPLNQRSTSTGEIHRRIEAERFLGLVLSDSPEAQWRHLLDLQAAGMDLETLLMEIMAPAIRELGEMWLNDRMSFVEVTTKSARLQHMIRSLGRPDSFQMTDGRASVLLAAAPGEQHTFGLFVLAELFLAAGWSVSLEANSSLDVLCELAESRRYDAIGMSVGSERFLPPVREQVAALRQATGSQTSRIFLGGWAFTVAGQSLDDYGADLVAVDGRSAVERAETLLIDR
ncbi:cobalamin B12-binding domain-containing protein [Jiella avicenniae]|uniref:Cobalamin B12-binding domain-containing protein n=1 Tax=Jiella avicenniae TaxID=2907202 RepID=A0A9X1P0F2_9HYPH|nr:cobalamin B12-binding domain-containing protein [Jiella avicenniae]MCE7027063.1 cobalamin B12-binding domain-containing protein [Jiella avicenniae]